MPMKWLFPKVTRRHTRLKTPEQEARAVRERAENEAAAAAGMPLPYPNPWDAWDSTKVAADASPDEITASYVEFSKRCRPRPRPQLTP